MLFFIFAIYYSLCLSILILCQPLFLSQFLSHKWGSRNVMPIFYEIQSYAISRWPFQYSAFWWVGCFWSRGLFPSTPYPLNTQCFTSNLNRGWYINFFCLYWHAEFITFFLENGWILDSWLFTVCASMQPPCRNEVLITVLILVLEYVKLMGLFCFHFQAIPNADLKQHYEAY